MQDKKDIIALVVSIIITVSASIFYFIPKDKADVDITTTSEIMSSVTETTTIKPTTTEIETTVPTTTEPITTTEPETTKQEVEITKEEVKITKEETIVSSDLKGTYSIPDNGGRFKSYTNYRLLSKSSPQWNKIQCHKDAYTDKNGLRKVGNYYCVAMGSYYSSTLGDTFEITTEGGTFQVVLCDFKANQHTDSTNRYTAHNGCVIEFYVDTDSLNSTARQMGDISYADSKFSGKIISITKTGNILN